MAGDMKDKFSAQANAAKHAADTTARRAGEQIKREGSRFLNEEKSAAAHEVEKVGAALNAAAEHLKKDDSFLAEWMRNTASAVDQASRSIAKGDIQDLYHSANRYAQKHPAFVIGGLFTLGVALSRFFKSDLPEQPAGGVERQTMEGALS